jgi:hypothetical protein
MSSNDPLFPPVTLHLIGNVVEGSERSLDIPPAMVDVVIIHANLDYYEFYRLIGTM